MLYSFGNVVSFQLILYESSVYHLKRKPTMNVLTLYRPNVRPRPEYSLQTGKNDPLAPSFRSIKTHLKAVRQIYLLATTMLVCYRVN